jgi:hypothetical protein
MTLDASNGVRRLPPQGRNNPIILVQPGQCEADSRAGARYGAIAALVVAQWSHQYRTPTRTLLADVPHHFSAITLGLSRAARPFQHTASRDHPSADMLKQTVFVIVDSCKHWILWADLLKPTVSKSRETGMVCRAAGRYG